MKKPKFNKTIFKAKGTKQSGFTVLESIIAIAILLIAITGPLVVVSQSLKGSYHSKYEITAYYLAQEAIEYVRWVRDSDVLGPSADSASWLKPSSNINKFDGCINNSISPDDNKCILTRDDSDPSNPDPYTLTPCDGGECPFVILGDTDPDNGIYGVTHGTDTIFKREIYLTKVPTKNADGSTTCGLDPNVGCDDREILMTVKVSWTSSMGPGEFTITESLYNWKASKTPTP
jgi:prepilin-type N-terminal cleavage/methylation domain-containing protein